MDTVVSARSYDVALLAVNAWLQGVEVVLTEKTSAFVLARPPGHHATRNYGMGFCIFSNAAIAAHYALQQPGVERVAILDWDVHHGNGTEALVHSNPHIAYCSLHEFPFYPGTGKASDQGDHGNVLNIPLEAGSVLGDYSRAFEEKIIPFLKNFAPNLLIISAGYDANRADPLSHICLKPTDYEHLTSYCLEISPHLLLGLEGGYDYETLSDSVVHTLQVLISRAKPAFTQ
jgi:acetoin utilization deacetylase AcuC-like enzyme